MIIFGDLSCPSNGNSEYLKRFFFDNRKIFGNHAWLINFEGLIAQNNEIKEADPVLYNDSSVLDVLNSDQEIVLSLANNHTNDLPSNFEYSLSLFKEKNIKYVGASQEPEKASEPVFLKEKSSEYIIFSFCWKILLHHKSKSAKPIAISTIKENEILEQVLSYRKQYPKNKIILYFHWNIDLENLPFPLYRDFARRLIDHGADLIVGSHSHCVQGAEEYKGKQIFYGIGNFFIPWYEYIGGRLKYPDISKRELIVEFNPLTNNCTCHWFDYEYSGGKSQLNYVGSNNFYEDPGMKKYSPYTGMSDKKYIRYFRKNRRKKFLMPVYKSMDQKLRNRFIDIYLVSRIRIARVLAKNRFWSWAK